MLERLFTSRARAGLLELFVLNPGKEFHLRGLARRVNVNPTYVKKELENLEALGLVGEEKKGNQLMFSVKTDSPLFAEIKGLYMKTEGIGMKLKERFEGMKGIRFALVYGSYAKGNQRKGSDIDLMIIGQADEKKLLAMVKGFEEKTGRELNYVLWTEKEFREKARQKTPLLEDIAKNKIIMIKGDENEFRRTVKE